MRGTLRARAERVAAKRKPDEKYTIARLQDLIQELMIHQAELEIQNEELRAAQIELKQSKDRYFDLYDSAPIGYLTLDAYSVITEINLAGAGMLGDDRYLLKKRVFWKFIAAEDRQKYYDHIEKARDSRIKQSCEVRLIPGHGGEIHVHMESVPQEDPRGNVTGFRSVLLDITRLKSVEDALRTSNEDLEQEVQKRTEDLRQTARLLEGQKELLQNILDHIPVMITLLDPAGKIRLVNREFERLLGRTLEQAREMDFVSAVRPISIDREGIWNYMQESKPGWLDFEITTDSGDVITSSWANIRLSDGSLIGIGIDVSERKKLEKERLRLYTAVGQAGEGVAVTGQDGVIEYVNPAYEKISGYGRDELIGKKVGSFTDYLAGSDTKEIYSRVVKEGKAWSGWQVRKRKSGEIIDVNLSISPVRDESGKVINFVSVVQDITEIKKAERELREVEARLAQTQRIEALDRFAGGIAHDLNNILYPIILNIEELLAEEPEDSIRHEILDQTLKAAYRQRDLVKKILSFGRRSEPVLSPIRIAQLVEETLDFVRSTLPSTIEIRQRIDAASDMILGDPTQIQQVIMNLCQNAADAFASSKGIIEVGLTKSRLEPDHARRDMPAGDYIEITVRDTGEGMPPEVMEHIFEPFYTTKGVGKGTGMGLSVAHGIVEKHGGAITARSKVGEGSLFTVYLPVYAGEFPAKASSPEQEHHAEGKEKILLIDDEEPILSSLQRVLEMSGYRVAAVKDGEEALRLFGREPFAYDLIITDLTMPRMTGIELARKFQHIRPDIPVILSTGYNDVISSEEAKSMGITELVLKPTAAGELKKAIRRALGH